MQRITHAFIAAAVMGLTALSASTAGAQYAHRGYAYGHGHGYNYGRGYGWSGRHYDGAYNSVDSPYAGAYDAYLGYPNDFQLQGR
jgi:hypothetical protein